jgi:hypothetical protein
VPSKVLTPLNPQLINEFAVAERSKPQCPVGSLYLTGLLLTNAYRSQACVPCVEVGTIVSGERNRPSEGSNQRATKK